MPTTPEQKQLRPARPPLAEKGAISKSTSVRHVVGDATNDWLAKNRSLVLRQSPVWAQSLAAVVISLGTLVVIGGFLFRIEEVVTVQGQLNAVGGSTEVMTPAGGQVDQVYAKDGEFVRRGTLLVRFDTTAAAKEAETLKRLVSLEESKFKEQMATYASRRSVLMNRLEVLGEKLKTKQEIVGSLQDLVDTGAYQRLPFLEQSDELLELNNQISQVKEEIEQLQFQANQLALENTRSTSEIQNRLVQVNLQLQYQNVKAPVDGIVFDSVARPQTVIPAGERMLTIVPQDSLYARVFIPNKDIGFIKPGQEAKVRVDAFPFTRYGDIPGRVDQIGADALPPDEANPIYRFPAKIKLDRPYLETQGIKVPLRSGMAVTTNLKLRDKPVISLLSDMLVDQLDAVRSIRQQ
jgi:HlyD family secretion protein